MPDCDGDAMICEQVWEAISQKRALTAAQAVHTEGCDACLAAWLDAAVAQALEAKPAVRIPAGFAERMAASLAEGRSASDGQVTRKYQQHWGLLTAIVLVAAGLIAVPVADPMGLNSQMGLVFVGIVVSEIAGIALWLGTRRPGERES